MRAKDLMESQVLAVGEDDTLEALGEVLVREHLHALPVVSASGHLVGMVTQQDLFFGQMTLGVGEAAAGRGASRTRAPMRVRDVMTSPAVCATEQTGIRKLCRLMYRLRIHRVPIVRRGRLVGVVSSLDVCSAVARGLVG